MQPRLLKDPPRGWAPPVFEDVEPWSRAGDILFVRLDSIGDVLMTTPAMRAFKDRGRRPPAGAALGGGAALSGGAAPSGGALEDGRTSITLLTSPVGAEAARFIPEIDEVIVYEAPWMKATPPRSNSVDMDMIARLQERRFEAAVIPTVYSQNPLPSALLCYLAGIPLRAAHCRENPYQLLTHWVKDPEPETLVRHEVQRQLDLAAALGATTEDRRLSFRVTAEAREQASLLLDEAGIEPAASWVLVHPGSTAPSRRYPPALFAQALRTLAEQTGAPLVLTGDAGDAELVEQITRELIGAPAPSGRGTACGGGRRAVPGRRHQGPVRVASLAGETSLDVLAAVIESAPVLLANNTGPVHIAAAVGTPVVDLYALTNPQHTPWNVPNRVLYADVPCRICYKSVCPQGHQRCLADIPPLAVAHAVVELLAERHGAQAR